MGRAGGLATLASTGETYVEVAVLLEPDDDMTDQDVVNRADRVVAPGGGK
jgi:hypothetical protein